MRGDGRRLLYQAPWFLVSLILVSTLGTIPGYPWGWLVVVAWLASGAIMLASHVWGFLTMRGQRLREASGVEKERLTLTAGPVAHVAGADSATYGLGVRDVEAPLAAASPGRVLAVTRWAATTLPPRELEAVLARDLGRTDRLDTTSGRIAYWYTVPARLLLGIAHGVSRVLVAMINRLPWLGWAITAFLVLCWIGMILTSQLKGAGLIGLIWYATPVVAPVLLAAVSRYAEKRADRSARETGRRRWLLGTQPATEARVRALDKLADKNRNRPNT
jgi:Zn-dependent protease with chaperone function